MKPFEQLNQIIILASIFILSDLFISGRSLAQINEWKLFNKENTMFPALTINNIIIDKDGNKWIAAPGIGIVKLKGKIWTLFNTENSGLQDNYIHALAFDKAYNLWIGSDNGLTKYDGNRWQVCNGYQSLLETRNQIEAIAVDFDLNVWVGVGQNGGGGGKCGLFKFDGENWISYNSRNSILPDYLVVTSVEVDKDSTIWIGTQIGLVKYDGTNWTIYDQSNSSIPFNFVASLSIDRYGNKWVGFYEKGVAKYDGKNWIAYNRLNSKLPNDHVNCVDVDAEDNIWIGTDNGLARLSNDSWEIFNKENSPLPGNIVKSIKVDNNDSVWIGTNSSGLAVLINGCWTILNQETPNYLPDNYISDIEIDKVGTIWIATYNGLAKFDGTFWTSYETSNSQLPSDRIYDIAVDDNNIKWIATEEGLVKFDGEYFEIYNTSNSGLPLYNNVHKLAVDLKGNLWLSTNQPSILSYYLEGSGLTKFDGVNWTTYTSENSGLPCNYISCITVDKTGNILVGTGLHNHSCNGLVQFNGEKWTIFNSDNSFIPSDKITSIAVDEFNNKWIAASPYRKSYNLPLQDGGLSKFNGSNWTVYNKDNSPLPSNEITTLSVDSENNVWIGGMGLQFFNGISWILFDINNSLLPSNNITTIFNDHHNTWIGTFPQYIENGKYTSGGIAVYCPSGVVLNIENLEQPQKNSSLNLSNYPNPFNISTIITYNIQQYSHVTLKIYDLLGNEIITLLNEEKQPGDYIVEFTNNKLSSGVYFYRLQVGHKFISKKMLLIK